MTPRRYDPDVVQARLRELRSLLEDLAALGHLTAEELREDRLRRHATERILISMVDLAVAVNSHVAAAVLGSAPSDYEDSFHRAAQAGLITAELAGRIAPSAGMRNVLVHRYQVIDLERVAAAMPAMLADFGEFVAQAARFTIPNASGD
jgi:uncharacterized protein YutE (UPF0331/DUF86 family)